MPRRKYTREFKESAAKLVSEQGYTAVEAAKSLGVDPNSIRYWVKKFPGNGSGAAVGEGALRVELRRTSRKGRVERGQAHLVTKRSARPYGADAWITGITHKVGLESTLRPRGRPRKQAAKPR